MLNTICKLHSNLEPDQLLRVLSCENIETDISLEDHIRKDGEILKVTRVNGSICALNPSHIIKVLLTSKSGWLI